MIDNVDLLRLQMTQGLGRVGLRRLMEAFEQTQGSLAVGSRELFRLAGIREGLEKNIPSVHAPELVRARRTLEGLAVRMLSLWDEDYPAHLRAIDDAPPLLYLRGDLPRCPCVAIVGSRKASSASLELAYEISRDLGSAGVSTISGLARGVDGRAHEGSLASGQATVGVLGCGIDRIYPPEHAGLYGRILEEGAILCEVPPGTAPLAYNFPGRNRIISGLAQAVLIVEAAKGSGSLITAEFALEQGRELMAIPGAVRSAGSLGPNQLIKEGATLITCAQDILDVLGVLSAPCVPARPMLCELDRDAQNVLAQLDFEPLHIDEVAFKCGLTPMELSDNLLDLELQGLICQLPGMRYVLKK